MKAPAFQFYPADWRKDPGVQALGFFERGVWFEMLCLMHESAERGVLLLNGQPMPADALANILGLDNQILEVSLTKLKAYGVAKVRQEDGAVYSKRMVEDERISKIRREAGNKGGNPALLNQVVNQTSNQNPTPSSSSSSSSSKRKRTPIVPDGDLLETVLSAYHDALPKCEQISARTPKRRKRIATADKLAKELCQQQGWDYEPTAFWTAYFGECAADPWMRGEVPNPNNPRWKQNLDVLLAEDRFAGVMDRAISAMRDAP